jgi:hypothetical protein
MIVVCGICALAVRSKDGDQWDAGFKRFFEELHIARLSVIKALQRPDIETTCFCGIFLPEWFVTQTDCTRRIYGFPLFVKHSKYIIPSIKLTYFDIIS